MDNRSQLRVYCPPRVINPAWDLSRGYDVFIQRDESKKEYMDHLLKWIQLHEHSKLSSSSSGTGACKGDGSTKK